MLACSKISVNGHTRSRSAISADHRAVTKEGATGTERVGDDIQRCDLRRLEVEESAPCRVVVDLKRVVGRTVEP